MRSSSLKMVIAVGACATVLTGAYPIAAKSGAMAAPAVAVGRPAPAPVVQRPIAPRPNPSGPIAQPGHPTPGMQGQMRPPHHHPGWPGRRFTSVVPGVPFFAYSMGWADPLTQSSEPLNAIYEAPYGGYYRPPTPCVPPTIIIIGSGMKGAVTPPTGNGGCTTPQVVYQKRADLRPAEPRRNKKRTRY
ncbi:MAG TPA: hypothetical protein VGU72_01570 [Beijerinckiaceae bacterium]|nr:hypothetical protein [Beijerinckiaceae bacterium]